MKLSDGSEIGISLETIAEANHNLIPCAEGFIWYQDHRVWRGAKKVEPVFTDNWHQVSLPTNNEEVKSVIGVTRKIDGKHFWAGFPLSELTCQNFTYSHEDWENLQRWLKSEPVKAFLTKAVEACKLQHETNPKPPAPCLPPELLTPFPRIFWPYLSQLNGGEIGVTETSAGIFPKVQVIFADWKRQQQKSFNLPN